MTQSPNQKGATFLEWSVLNYWDKMSDAQLAAEIHVSIEEVRQARIDLNRQLPVGATTMKEYARKYLLEMPDLEKKEFLARLDPDLIWQMAEGKAATTGELTVNTEPVKIDITHHLLKVYGPDAGRIIDHVADDGEGRELAGGSGK